MNERTKLRTAFVQGYNDALDAYSRPSVRLASKAEEIAWQAGWDHWQKLVYDEQRRICAALERDTDDFPKW